MRHNWLSGPKNPNVRSAERKTHDSVMDLPRILGALREELARLNEAIFALERFQTTVLEKRGLRPKWLR